MATTRLYLRNPIIKAAKGHKTTLIGFGRLTTASSDKGLVTSELPKLVKPPLPGGVYSTRRRFRSLLL